MFTISLCMIVKDEEDVLERVLVSAEKFADEIVIVDTGSTDGTKEIAKKHTDKVYDYTWQNDFSKARNYAFSLGTCDYLMWLDADDVVDDENVAKIIALKNSTENADVFMCKYLLGIDENGKASLSYYRERILKRSEKFLWQGFVHEAITPHGEIKYTDIEIQHRKIHASDPKRNLKLYQYALANGVKLNARERYYYSRELYYNGKIEEAIGGFKIFLAMPNTYVPDNLGAHIMLADCYKNLSQPINALDTLFSCLKKHQPTSEICCKIGYIFDELNRHAAAIFWFKAALDCPKQEEGFVNEDFQDFIPNIELSKLLFESDFESAREHHLKAKALKPTHPSVLYNEQFFK